MGTARKICWNRLKGWVPILQPAQMENSDANASEVSSTQRQFQGFSTSVQRRLGVLVNTKCIKSKTCETKEIQNKPPILDFVPFDRTLPVGSSLSTTTTTSTHAAVGRFLPGATVEPAGFETERCCVSWFLLPSNCWEQCETYTTDGTQIYDNRCNQQKWSHLLLHQSLEGLRCGSGDDTASTAHDFSGSQQTSGHSFGFLCCSQFLHC